MNAASALVRDSMAAVIFCARMHSGSQVGCGESDQSEVFFPQKLQKTSLGVERRSISASSIAMANIPYHSNQIRPSNSDCSAFRVACSDRDLRTAGWPAGSAASAEDRPETLNHHTRLDSRPSHTQPAQPEAEAISISWGKHSPYAGNRQ